MCLLGPPLIHMLMLTRLQYYTIDSCHPQSCLKIITFPIEDNERSLKSLKSGKAHGIDKISKEHIMFSHRQFLFMFCAYLIVDLSSRVVSASHCGVRGPVFESRRGQLCLSRQLLRYTVLSTGCAVHLYCSA